MLAQHMDMNGMRCLQLLSYMPLVFRSQATSMGAVKNLIYYCTSLSQSFSTFTYIIMLIITAFIKSQYPLWVIGIYIQHALVLKDWNFGWHSATWGRIWNWWWWGGGGEWQCWFRTEERFRKWSTRQGQVAQFRYSCSGNEYNNTHSHHAHIKFLMASTNHKNYVTTHVTKIHKFCSSFKDQLCYLENSG